eukprot:CAMPEP_0174322554 /NCGR_PEP_ID=MMETSP0810-20121108/11069_1 /TAXON_ID=73025 ORGANISM="Eutreptiella gymnastica-like, Strain CCMP1594" /NCGR_SAMPLE_ID=MMETSP0810 /ASSEMBLY_ACC=CAM_ASM_000659 /LENGTH=99 /DNA_ID=CAMNT_0015434389 /DNA_START=517 /DNA_END=816 /DNA_ORIENTATION=+
MEPNTTEQNRTERNAKQHAALQRHATRNTQHSRAAPAAQGETFCGDTRATRAQCPDLRVRPMPHPLRPYDMVFGDHVGLPDIKRECPIRRIPAAEGPHM